MAKHKKHADHEEHIDESWLIPYADLLTLLLALFIVLFCSSSSNEAKFEEMKEAFQKEMGIFKPGSNELLIIPSEIAQGQQGELAGKDANNSDLEDLFQNYDLEKIEEVKESLEGFFEEEGISAEIDMHIDERGLVISLHDKMLFDSGSASIKPENRDTLIQVGRNIDVLENYIRVEGHTDNVPISSRARFASNWELSVLRSTNVIDLFISEAGISPDKLVAVGYGEFKPVGDNNTPEGRAQNRRVDIILLNSKYNTLENPLEDITHIEN